MPRLYSTSGYRLLALWWVLSSLCGQVLHPLLHHDGCSEVPAAATGTHCCGHAPGADHGHGSPTAWGCSAPIHHSPCAQCVIGCTHTTSPVAPATIARTLQPPTPLGPHAVDRPHVVGVLLLACRAPPTL